MLHFLALAVAAVAQEEQCDAATLKDQLFVAHWSHARDRANETRGSNRSRRRHGHRTPWDRSRLAGADGSTAAAPRTRRRSLRTRRRRRFGPPVDQWSDRSPLEGPLQVPKAGGTAFADLAKRIVCAKNARFGPGETTMGFEKLNPCCVPNFCADARTRTARAEHARWSWLCCILQEDDAGVSTPQKSSKTNGPRLADAGAWPRRRRARSS